MGFGPQILLKNSLQVQNAFVVLLCDFYVKLVEMIGIRIALQYKLFIFNQLKTVTKQQFKLSLSSMLRLQNAIRHR